MNIYEIVGTVTGLICVILVIKRNIWNWPVGIISVAAFAVLFWQIKLYADMALQVFFIVTGFIGWWMWAYGGEARKELKVRTLSGLARTLILLSFVPVYLAIAWALDTFTDASIPYLDAFASTLSVYAQVLLMRKVLENWYAWIAVDILSIGIYAYKHVYWTMGLYSVLLVLAVAGLIEWLLVVKLGDVFRSETEKKA